MIVAVNCPRFFPTFRSEAAAAYACVMRSNKSGCGGGSGGGRKTKLLLIPLHFPLSPISPPPFSSLFSTSQLWVPHAIAAQLLRNNLIRGFCLLKISCFQVSPQTSCCLKCSRCREYTCESVEGRRGGENGSRSAAAAAVTLP